MLVFNEGLPRAGKSYDAVKTHILPALKRGRRVFARLNGLDHAAIAAYLSLPESRVRDLLVCVDTGQVRDTFRCALGPGGQWVIPDKFKDSLCVIDEVHEFYVNARSPLPPAEENFFALIGQNGGDVVIMTQAIKRLHSAVFLRIERKTVFQKLTAVGKKDQYRATYYHATAPGKFEKVGATTEDYDPAIYPLYHGYAPGAENVEVYEAGGKTVWAMLAPKAVLFGIPALIGGGFLLWFFASAGSGLVDESKQTIGAPRDAQVGQVWQPSAAVEPRGPAESWEQKRKREAAERLDQLTPSQRYVMQLSERGRVRLSGRMDVGGVSRVVVEWIDQEGRPVERLTGDALVALGVDVAAAAYGVLLKAGTEEAVVTAWPLTQVVRDQEQRLYRLDGAGGSVGGVSIDEPPAAAAVTGGARGRSGGDDPVPAYGGFRS